MKAGQRVCVFCLRSGAEADCTTQFCDSRPTESPFELLLGFEMELHIVKASYWKHCFYVITVVVIAALAVIIPYPQEMY